MFFEANIFAASPKIDWQPWSDAVFQRAKEENKFVLLDLGAVWCHWCHVMDETTYRDAKTIALINARYLAVHVDQDARPDLSNRYEDYGWPATVIFAADRSEIVKRRGYIPPKEMAELLQAVINDPSPGPSVQPEVKLKFTSAHALTPEQRDQLRAKFFGAYDTERGGWGRGHKYLDWDALEYCLAEANGGEARAAKIIRQTLDAGRNLIDPVWGGIYQYSTDGDWNHPHFEKIMPFQAENLRVFSLAYSRWNNPADLQSAQQIRSYLKNFLTSPDGAFYTSQDADVVRGEHSANYFALDDSHRSKQGVPRVDQHIYARENGLAIAGITSLYAVTRNTNFLAEARRAAEWIIANRSSPGGGFRHDTKDMAGPYLADTLAMGRAFLQLYAVTAERNWLERARHAAGFIENNFKSTAGYATAADVPGESFKPKPQVEENVALARFGNLLHRYSRENNFRAIAEHAMRFLATPAISERRGFSVGGILLADREMFAEPQHITIVGEKSDPLARELFAESVASPAVFKQTEWLDSREGDLPGNEIRFPKIKIAAAFLCSGQSCSAPISDPKKLREKLRHSP